MSEHFEQDFATSAQRRRGWGGALLLVAGIIWVVLAYQLMAPFEAGEDSGSRKCQSMLFYEGDEDPTRAEASWDDCRAERRWPEMLGWLGLSVPLSVGGAALYTSGATSLRMREYMAEHRIAAAKREARKD
ncbi:hypothetical protein [Streptomyces longisporoflavus]|uniref:Transmembrane protein n=1 Tax=Streptomyces longisporoflavus TaxID=28044 RepID=A0ABW7QVB3_9ACTN